MTSNRLSLGALALCLCAALPALAGAQATRLHVEGDKKLLSEAKINPDSAAAIAMAKVPGTSASSAKIEKEGNALVYSVNLLRPGNKGVDRVWIDGNTGAIRKTKHYGGLSGDIRHSHQEHEMKEAKHNKP